jgi:hypothetical protein
MQEHLFSFGMVGDFGGMVEKLPAVDLQYDGISDGILGILTDF